MNKGNKGSINVGIAGHYLLSSYTYIKLGFSTETTLHTGFGKISVGGGDFFFSCNNTVFI